MKNYYVYCIYFLISAQLHLWYPQEACWHLQVPILITDHYAPYCDELRYSVFIKNRELAEYWWMQQDMNSLFVRHILYVYQFFTVIVMDWTTIRPP